MSGRIKPLSGDGTKRHSRKEFPRPCANRQHDLNRKRKAIRENPGSEKLAALKAAYRAVQKAKAAAPSVATDPA